MEKRGDLREDSHSDFDQRKKVKYVDAGSNKVAGEGEQHLLDKPVAIKAIGPTPIPPGYSWRILN